MGYINEVSGAKYVYYLLDTPPKPGSQHIGHGGLPKLLVKKLAPDCQRRVERRSVDGTNLYIPPLEVVSLNDWDTTVNISRHMANIPKELKVIHVICIIVFIRTPIGCAAVIQGTSIPSLACMSF